MANKKAPRKFPVRLWLGKYEQWLLVMKSPNNGMLYNYDKVLERFFSTFPKKQGLEEFSSVDVVDYRAIRESQGASNGRLKWELQILRSFWRWLIVDKELPILNIKRAFDIQVEQVTITKRAGISLDCVKRLLVECDPRTREIVFEIMLEKRRFPRGKMAGAIEIAARKAGLRNFCIKKLRIATTQRLGLDIVQAYCQQLRESFALESKNAGHPLTNIEGPALDERATVSNHDNNLLPVTGVNQ